MSDYWKDNGIEKPQQVVVCAACKLNGLILCSARHWDKLMNEQYRQIKPAIGYASTALFTQGFINQFGEFLTREEAMQAAKDAGQSIDIERGCCGDENTLYSEGLY